MDMTSQTLCKALIEKCRKTTDNEGYCRIRNELFSIM